MVSIKYWLSYKTELSVIHGPVGMPLSIDYNFFDLGGKRPPLPPELSPLSHYQMAIYHAWYLFRSMLLLLYSGQLRHATVFFKK